MFAPHCPRHGRRVLLGDDDILSVTNGPEGIAVDWRCFCGHQGRSQYQHSGATVTRRAGRLLA